MQNLEQIKEAWSYHAQSEQCGCIARLKYRVFDGEEFKLLLASLKEMPLFRSAIHNVAKLSNEKVNLLVSC